MLKITLTMLMMMIMDNKQAMMAVCGLVATFNLQHQYLETSKMSYVLMGDPISFWVTNLTLWIMALVMMIKVSNSHTSMKISVVMLLTLTLTFHTWNFLLFFLMFEVAMVTIVLVIMSWGYQPERGEAVLFMILMTSMLALPFFYTLMKNRASLSFWFTNVNMMTWDYLSFMFIFMIKLPAYFMHIWLPKVHVESPVQGSMVLAAVMLKLGCYGMIRIIPAGFKTNAQLEPMIVAFSLWTAITLSSVASIQCDLKTLIAYSSIVHMAATFAGITLVKPKSMVASMIIMIGHGLCSSALFLACNQMYKCSKSRSLILNKGILNSSPALMLTWFVLCMGNAPMPPSINVIGEILLFKTVLSWSAVTLLPTIALMFMSSYYSIMLFYLPSHGKSGQNMKNPVTVNSKTLHLIWMHAIPLTGLTLKANMLEI